MHSGSDKVSFDWFAQWYVHVPELLRILWCLRLLRLALLLAQVPAGPCVLPRNRQAQQAEGERTDSAWPPVKTPSRLSCRVLAGAGPRSGSLAG